MMIYMKTEKRKGENELTTTELSFGYLRKPTPFNSKGKAYLAAGVTVVLAVWALYATSIPVEAMP